MGWTEPKSNYTAESQVTPEIFNTLAENEKYLQEKKITTEQVQDAEINSVQSGTRESIGDKETVKGFFGKIRKWLAGGNKRYRQYGSDVGEDRYGCGNVGEIGKQCGNCSQDSRQRSRNG